MNLQIYYKCVLCSFAYEPLHQWRNRAQPIVKSIPAHAALTRFVVVKVKVNHVAHLVAAAVHVPAAAVGGWTAAGRFGSSAQRACNHKQWC